MKKKELEMANLKHLKGNGTNWERTVLEREKLMKGNPKSKHLEKGIMERRKLEKGNSEKETSEKDTSEKDNSETRQF